MNDIEKAVTLLQKGQLVILPTETVYGLVCDPRHLSAIQTIYTVKNRPEDKALSILIPDVTDLEQWAIDIPDQAYQLAKRYWPGPLTLILKKAPHVSALITAGKNTIGLRIPNHPITLAILRELGHGVCAPSANFSGKPAPRSYSEIDPELLKRVAFTIDGGSCQVGQASTIIDCTQPQPIIIRQGIINLTY